MRKRWPRVLAAITVLSVVIVLLVVGCKKIHTLHARHQCGTHSVGKVSKRCAKPDRTARRRSAAPCFPVTSLAAQEEANRTPSR
jgi:hypothetical protein